MKKMTCFDVRTDLALEEREAILEKISDIEGINGVSVEEKYHKPEDIHVVKIEIKNKKGEQMLRKPMGTYITLECKYMCDDSEDNHREISIILAEYIKELMMPILNEDCTNILVVGLGNRNVTPDALGPQVVENIVISRESAHIDKKIRVMGIIPGVMAQTGMETADIIRGISKETKPDVIIAIDALAARRIERLNRTIQLTDTGIHPGSGVKNDRKAITKETMGVEVIGIGVPTVIDTKTIVIDMMESIVREFDCNNNMQEMCKFRKVSSNEKRKLLQELIEPNLESLFVTPKDTDETVKRLGYTISEAINIATETAQKKCKKLD